MTSVAVALAALVPLGLGGLLVLRAGGTVIGWLLVLHGASVVLLLGRPGAWSSADTDTRHELIADQLLAGAWVFLFVWLVLVVHLLPDGRPLSPRWRALVIGGVIGAGMVVVGAAGDWTGFVASHGGAAPPLTWLSETASGVIGVVGLAMVVAMVVLAPVVVHLRWRNADERTRDQLMWIAWGALSIPVALGLLWANRAWLGDSDALTASVLGAVGVVVPTTISIAVVRHGLLDIRVLLGRTLTYLILLGGVSLLYAGILSATLHVTDDARTGGWLATAVVAVGVHPAFAWLREHVERRVHGYRGDPHRALRLLADRVGRNDSPVLEAVTDVVAQVLRAEAAWIDGPDEVDVLTGPGVVRTPMVHRDEHVGHLAVALAPDAVPTSGDERLLRDLATYAAVIVRSERQSRLLADSRLRIVAGREEERRRLRHDLHDGIGPSLAAVVLQLDAARSSTDVERTARLLAEARVGVREAIDELRRAVDDLRPPALDEVGLVVALRQRASALAVDTHIEVTGPDPVPALPAAAEVAAFRIASEAMLNVVRHARATRCQVGVEVGSRLVVTVVDDGRGTPDSSGGGTGLGQTSMRERAAEIGGTCTFTMRPGTGLLVRAELPLDTVSVVIEGGVASAEDDDIGLGTGVRP